jgi:hypothetical protein
MTTTTTTTIIFVTSFIKIYETPPNNTRTEEWRIKHFELLLKTGIHIHLFISPEYHDIFEKLRHKYYQNFNYSTIDIYTKLPLFSSLYHKNEEINLPMERNHEKDTYQYMALMNSKLEFINLATKYYTTATHFAWIDFNIPYIFKEPEFTLSFLNFVSTANFISTNFLYIPGCWQMPSSYTPLIIDNINWHFCGGFFLGDRQSVLDFYKANIQHIYEETVNKSLMVWETNFWTFLESNHIWKPSHWVSVNDHDDTMITKIPTELYIHPLKWVTIIPFDEIGGDLQFPDKNYNLSSISYTKHRDTKEEFVVCRFINYRLSEDGRQYIYKNDDTTIKNRNLLINLSTNETKELIHSPFEKFSESFSIGLEDIRIYPDLSFSATSVSVTNGKLPQIVYGHIDPQKGCVTSLQHINSPLDRHYGGAGGGGDGDLTCEKNWIFIKDESSGVNVVIYRWFPFQIATFDEKTNNINIVLSLNLTPQYLFRNMRGSTAFYNYSIYKNNCKYNGDWLVGLIHYSIDQPNYIDIARKYYHSLVLLNKKTLIPFAITHPFTFNQSHGIEFCIGMRYENEIFTFWVSIMDRSPMIYTIHNDQIDFDILIGNSYIPVNHG